MLMMVHIYHVFGWGADRSVSDSFSNNSPLQRAVNTLPAVTGSLRWTGEPDHTVRGKESDL